VPRFDVHQHLWPEELVAELARRSTPPCLRDSVLSLAGEGEFDVDLEEHDLARRLELMDRDGTEVAVISLQPTLGIDALPDAERQPLFAAWHDGARRIVAVSKGRFRAFAAAECPDGFAGACVPASAVIEGRPELDALLADLAARGRVLFVHPGPARPPVGAPKWWASVVAYTAEMQAAYLAWLARRAAGVARPPAIFAALAGGGPIQLERLAARGGDEQPALDPSVFLEVSSYGRRALELCQATFGVRQLLYGSDLPIADPRPTLGAVQALGDSAADVIVAENATRLLG
jgi:hypothetical protein